MPQIQNARAQRNSPAKNICRDGPQVFRLVVAEQSLEAELWQNVQQAYGRARGYRASDNPEYAKALATWERVAFPGIGPREVPALTPSPPHHRRGEDDDRL